MKITLFKFGLFLALVLATYFPLRADTVAPPCSYKIESANKKFIFAMIAPDETTDCISHNEDDKNQAKKLRNKFPISGLYTNDQSINPLWTVNWYSYRVYLSSDGKYLVRTGPWASKETDEAFSFFNEGKLIKTYQINEIVRYISALPRSVSHFQWEKELKLNASTNTFEVKTLEDGKLNFNIETGEIINEQKPLIPSFERTNTSVLDALTLLGIVCLILLVLICIFSLRKKLFPKN